jgi:hypothetical protein
MATNIKRRYPDQKTVEHRIYTEYFDRFTLNSAVLNSGSKPFNIHSIFWTKENIVNNLVELEGNQEGKYWNREGVFIDADITVAKTHLENLNSKFKDYQDKLENEGKEITDNWPIELLTERLKWEAQLDVYNREVESLKAELAKINEKDDTVSSDKVLAWGLECSGQLRGGVLIVLDGQTISELPSGKLIIDDKHSCYNGMLVSDYRKLATAWNKSRITRAGIKVKREDLPSWPDWAINQLAKSDET